jgi:hypothetical protein
MFSTKVLNRSLLTAVFHINRYRTFSHWISNPGACAAAKSQRSLRSLGHCQWALVAWMTSEDYHRSKTMAGSLEATCAMKAEKNAWLFHPIANIQIIDVLVCIWCVLKKLPNVDPMFGIPTESQPWITDLDDQLDPWGCTVYSFWVINRWPKNRWGMTNWIPQPTIWLCLT